MYEGRASTPFNIGTSVRPVAADETKRKLFEDFLSPIENQKRFATLINPLNYCHVARFQNDRISRMQHRKRSNETIELVPLQGLVWFNDGAVNGGVKEVKILKKHHVAMQTEGSQIRSAYFL